MCSPFAACADVPFTQDLMLALSQVVDNIWLQYAMDFACIMGNMQQSTPKYQLHLQCMSKVLSAALQTLRPTSAARSVLRLTAKADEVLLAKAFAKAFEIPIGSETAHGACDSGSDSGSDSDCDSETDDGVEAYESAHGDSESDGETD
jgi:hypothetical protein